MVYSPQSNQVSIRPVSPADRMNAVADDSGRTGGSANLVVRQVAAGQMIASATDPASAAATRNAGERGRSGGRDS